MATWSDIRNRQYIDSITLEIVRADFEDGEKRQWALTVRDIEGNEFDLDIWQKHDIGIDWEQGTSYDITRPYGQVWSDGQKRKLHSSGSFSASPLDQGSKATQVLVLGDSHVGYRHRPRSDKGWWAQDVDNRETLARALTRARKQDVDAVIHTGDLFGEYPKPDDREPVTHAIEETLDAGIPFYYIYGNHSTDYAKDVLSKLQGKETDCLPLDDSPLSIGSGSANRYGIDYDASEDDIEIQAPKRQDATQNILVIHRTPYPFVDDSGEERYNDSNHINISDFFESQDIDFDLVIVGHLHVARQGFVRDTDTRVLVVGPTGPIGYKQDSRPSTWLLTLDENGYEIVRQEL